MDANKLKQRIEVLEKENQLLKKSLFELSIRTNSSKNATPYQLKELLDNNGMDQITTLFDNKTEEEGRYVGKGEKNRYFYEKCELKGHGGAVYTVKFSPCGKWIASGSFDRTIRIWDPNTQKEVHCLNGHALNISNLSWARDSSELLSGAYDQTCRVWDVEQSKQIELFESDGFVQCVQFCPTNPHLFFSGTSRNILSITDRRQPSNCMNLRNESMINTISAFRDGSHVVSGDATGNIKTWDVRAGKCIHNFLNETTKKPISHIAACPADNPEEEPRYMAVNSYDNVMRVYDRGTTLPIASYNLIHALKGYKNKNWPIRSCFFKFKEGSPSVFGKAASTEDLENVSSAEKSMEASSLLATGSADPFIYVYSIGQQEGSSTFLQKLEGHTDRVYTCHFHPTEPLIASGSADFSVKLWACRKISKGVF